MHVTCDSFPGCVRKLLGWVHQQMCSRMFCGSIVYNSKNLEILKYTLVAER